MPTRRRVLRSVAALSAVTVPGTAAARTDRPPADVDAALDAFGSGAVDGRITPRALARLDDAISTVAARAPAVADESIGRLPSTPAATASDGSALGALSDADLRVTTVGPSIDGIAALTVGIDFAARGPVVRARVTGADGTPARGEALDALAAAGLPVATLEPFAVRDGDDLALYAGIAARDGEQSVVLALLLVVLAAVVGTFVLGFNNDPSRVTPQASFTFDYESDGTLTVTHDGGDRIPADQLRIIGDGVSRHWGESGTVTAGDSVTVQVPADATVRVIWSGPEGEDSATLAKWIGPDA